MDTLTTPTLGNTGNKRYGEYRYDDPTVSGTMGFSPEDASRYVDALNKRMASAIARNDGSVVNNVIRVAEEFEVLILKDPDELRALLMFFVMYQFRISDVIELEKILKRLIGAISRCGNLGEINDDNIELAKAVGDAIALLAKKSKTCTTCAKRETCGENSSCSG